MYIVSFRCLIFGRWFLRVFQLIIFSSTLIISPSQRAYENAVKSTKYSRKDYLIITECYHLIIIPYTNTSDEPREMSTRARTLKNISHQVNTHSYIIIWPLFHEKFKELKHRSFLCRERNSKWWKHRYERRRWNISNHQFARSQIFRMGRVCSEFQRLYVN